MAARTESEREELAIEVVAKRLVQHAVSAVGRDGKWTPAWEDYPDLSSEQWGMVVDKARDLAEQQNPSEDDFRSCYEYLTGEAP